MRFEEVLVELRDEGKPVRRDAWSACLTLRLQGGALEWDWGPVFGPSRTGWEISAGDLTADDWRVVAAVVGAGMRGAPQTETGFAPLGPGGYDGGGGDAPWR